MPQYNDLLSNPRFANAHAQMQELAINLKQQFQLEALFDDVLYEQGTALSPAAQLMLIGPIIEAIEMQKYWQERGIQDTAVNVTDNDIRQSLSQIVLEAKTHPARADLFPDELKMEDSSGKKWPMLSTFSVIKSFVRRYCNIPPFCGETE